jgi:glycosyltransferase involved in cell wall biosynthesis
VKVSIVIAIYNSHKVVIRQIRHFKHMHLPDDVEIIFMDDGSNPPITYRTFTKNFNIYRIEEKRAWTQGLARNIGAKIAKGEFIFFTDIDHIITREAIEAVRNFKEDKMIFRRRFGIFDRRGNILSDVQTLEKFGINPKYRRREYQGGIHGNTYAIRRTVFFELGGYNPKYCENEFHVGGNYMSEERNFNIRWINRVERKESKPESSGPDIYFYPLGRFHATGDENPGGLFHNLSRVQVKQPLKP